jgi:hypothetical protein
VSRHSNPQVVRDAAILLLTPGCTPESVAGFLRQAAEGNGDITVPSPRAPEDVRQVTP